MTITHCDVLVIGGGIVGLTVAKAMASRQQSVVVVDARSLEIGPQSLSDRRVYALNHASKKLLQQLGVWSLMDASRISPYQHMHVWDAASQGCIDFDARMIASPDLGVIVDEGCIKQALLQSLGEHDNVTRCSFNTISKISQENNFMLVASEQQSWQAGLVIIADGAESPSRQLLQVPVTSWPYHQHALVATVITEKPHQKTAWQVFNPDGPLAFLPFVDEHRCSIVWSTSPKRASELQAMEPELFNQALASAFAHKLGATTLSGARYHFPLIMRHAQQLVGRNWALMGDAAHTVHPLAGQGLNIGLADVSSFLEKKSLQSWQRQRKQAIWQSVALLGGIKSLFANPLFPWVVSRGLGLALCNKLSPVKRLFIQHATGL